MAYPFGKQEKSKYAQAGVDFEKEHDVVDVMVKVGNDTAKNIDDLKELGVGFPDEGSDFSGGLMFDLEVMVKSGIKKMVQSGGVDGPGSKPVVHALYDGEDATKKCNDMIEIKDAYYKNKKECAYLIEEFKDNYGQKINII